jgi:hypothetical protein
MGSYQGTGTWGPQTGILGAINPFSRDRGFTEQTPLAQMNPGLFQNPNIASPSNIISPVPNVRRVVVAGGGPSPTGQTLGVQNTNTNTKTRKSVTNTNTNTNTGGGQQGESEAGKSQQTQVPQGPSESDINAVYDPTMGYLNQAESNVRSDFPNVLDQAQQSYETAIAELTAGKTKNEGTITQNVTTATNRKEDALTAARRLYDELRRGYQQRFGGSTSAGQAASELSSVEQQRQMGQTNRGFNDTMAQIEQSKVQLDQDFQTGSMKILQYKNDAITSANRDFQNKLLEIQGKRAETESAKAQYRLQALTDLRNQAYAASQQAQQFQQQLEMQKQSQQADLQTYAAKLQMAGQGVSSVTNQYNPMGNVQSGLQVGSSGGQNTTPQYTGIKTSRPEDELRGAINQKLDPYGLQSTLYGRK